MSAVVSRAVPRLALKKRKKGDVLRARPTTGDHHKIVRSAAFEATLQQHDLFVELAKI